VSAFWGLLGFNTLVLFLAALLASDGTLTISLRRKPQPPKPKPPTGGTE
jgi:hypothetical protein